MADTVTQAPAAVPGDLVPSGWSLAVRQLRFWLTDYRRTWRGSIYSSVLNPLLFLGAMGLGLGSLVNQHGTARLGGVSYLAFLAPGLLAAAAMETGVGEATYPVYGSVKWNKTYQAAVARHINLRVLGQHALPLHPILPCVIAGRDRQPRTRMTCSRFGGLKYTENPLMQIQIPDVRPVMGENY